MKEGVNSIVDKNPKRDNWLKFSRVKLKVYLKMALFSKKYLLYVLKSVAVQVVKQLAELNSLHFCFIYSHNPLVFMERGKA